MSDPATSVDDAAGHRARLRARLLGHGGEALPDYELLEYLLALAIPRRDTKPLAKALLREFGGLAGVMTANPDALTRIKGMGETSAAAIKVAHAVALRLLKRESHERPLLANWQALLDYLRADMAHHGIERVRVLHLDAKNRLIRDEVTGEGTIDEAPVYAREVVRRAVAADLAAGAFLIAVPYVRRTSRQRRVNLSLDTGTLDAIDSAAASAGLTRSGFVAMAALNEIRGAH